MKIAWRMYKVRRNIGGGQKALETVTSIKWTKITEQIKKNWDPEREEVMAISQKLKAQAVWGQC